MASALDKMDASSPSSSSSSSSSSPSDGPRTIPTRHSRSLPAPVCSHQTLPSLTSSLLQSPPGSLFSYPQTDASLGLSLEEELDRAAELSDSVRQKFEYCLRGHSALIAGSIVDKELFRDRPECYGSDEEWGDGVAMAGMVPREGTEEHREWLALREYSGGDGEDGPYGALSPLERVEIMDSLVGRVEEEGRLYAEMRSRLKSQVARVGELGSPQSAAGGANEDIPGAYDSLSSSDSESDSDSDFSDSEVDYGSAASSASAWRADQLVAEFGSSPGASTAMYDLLLDAIAVTAPLTPIPRFAAPDDPFVPQRAYDVHNRIIDRHNADGGQDNVNRQSVPTAMSYNAVIMAAVRTPYDPKDSSERSRMTRDMCIESSFRMYDAMHHSDVVNRNPATFVLMLKLMAKYFPPSRSRGNISYGLFVKAGEEGVVNEAVTAALSEAMTPSNGKEFDDYMKKMEGQVKERGELPPRWTKHSKWRMYRKWDSGY